MMRLSLSDGDSITVSILGLGAMPLSLQGRPNQHDAIKVIERYINVGGNFIDTADVYGFDDSDRGHNERLIAEALMQMGSQNDIVIATKGGATRPQGGWGLRGGGHPDKLRLACEASLKNLNRDYIDLYYLHGPDPDIPLEDSLGALIRMQEWGYIRNIGIANVNVAQLKLACTLAPISVVQNRCNLFCKSDLSNGLMSECVARQITYIAYCPLGGWHDHKKLMSSQYFTPIINKYHVSAYQISLAWLHNQKIIPIPGMDRVSQVDENFQAFNLELDEEDLHLIANFPDWYAPAHVDS